MSVDEIIREAMALPVGERLALVDSLLESIHLPEPEIEQEWVAIAERRIDEMRNGAATTISSAAFLAEIRARFPKA